MTMTLKIHRVGPGATLQDLGRVGFVDSGVSRGGAADRKAIYEGAALLRQGVNLPVVELMGMGGEFESDTDTRIALTGAPMRAQIDGSAVAWNASHKLPAGARLTIGAALEGTYGYLHIGGGFDAPRQLNSASAHLSAGIGKVLQAGDELLVGEDTKDDCGDYLEKDNRFDGGVVRVVASFQTDLFEADDIGRFEKAVFTRDVRGNRMGVRMNPPCEGFSAASGKTVLSESIMPGDIQITGDGTPYVLLAECQTTGGYPRIGTVLPCDLPRVAQAPAGSKLIFQFVELGDAIEIERADKALRQSYGRLKKPLIRDPHKMHDLLSYNLISGMIAGTEFDDWTA